MAFRCRKTKSLKCLKCLKRSPATSMLARERASRFDDEAAPLTMPAWVASDGAFVLDIVLWAGPEQQEDAC